MGILFININFLCSFMLHTKKIKQTVTFCKLTIFNETDSIEKLYMIWLCNDFFNVLLNVGYISQSSIHSMLSQSMQGPLFRVCFGYSILLSQSIPIPVPVHIIANHSGKFTVYLSVYMYS